MSKNYAWLVVMATLLILLVAGSGPTPSRIATQGLSTYVTAAATDPFFALPGTNTETLTSSVEAFEKTLSVALPSFPETDVQPYPVAFLKTLSKAEAARRQLIQSPSARHAVLYHTALRKVFTAYSADISRILEYVDSPDTASTPYGFLSGETTRGHVQQVLRENLARVAAYATQENKRFSCIDTPSIICTIETHLPSPGVNSAVGYQTSTVDAILNLLHTHESAERSGESTVVELPTSTCYPGHEPALYDVASTTSRLSGAPMVWMRPLNNLYLYDLSSTTRQTLVALREAGARYEYQPFHAYLCPDFGVDVSHALTALYAHTLLSAEPFATTDPAFVSLLQAQEAFLARTPISELSFRHLAAEASTILAHQDTSTSIAQFGEKEVRRLQELVLLSRTNSGYFERIIGYFDDFQAGNAVFFPVHSGPIEDFVITRGGLSALLLIFNETAADPSSASLLAHKNRTAVPIPELRAYWGDLDRELSLTELPMVFQEISRAHRTVYEPRIDALIARRQATKP